MNNWKMHDWNRYYTPRELNALIEQTEHTHISYQLNGEKYRPHRTDSECHAGYLSEEDLDIDAALGRSPSEVAPLFLLKELRYRRGDLLEITLTHVDFKPSDVLAEHVASEEPLRRTAEVGKYRHTPGHKPIVITEVL